jgi:hypothetical protein
MEAGTEELRPSAHQPLMPKVEPVPNDESREDGELKADRCESSYDVEKLDSLCDDDEKDK